MESSVCPGSGARDFWAPGLQIPVFPDSQETALPIAATPGIFQGPLYAVSSEHDAIKTCVGMEAVTECQGPRDRVRAVTNEGVCGNRRREEILLTAQLFAQNKFVSEIPFQRLL